MFSSVQPLSHVWLFATPWTAARQASLSFTNSLILLKLMSSSQWCHPTISFSIVPFPSRLQSFPPSGSFPRSQFCASGGQSIRVSASTTVLSMNIQDWFPFGLTDLICLQSKTFKSLVQHHSSKTLISLALSFLYSPTLTSIPDYWKKHSFSSIDRPLLTK